MPLDLAAYFSDALRIVVTSPGGTEVVRLTLEPRTSLAELRRRVAEAAGVSAWRLRLFNGTDELTTMAACSDVRDNAILSMVVSPSPHRILIATGDATCKLVDCESGRYVKSFEGHGVEVTMAVFSADGSKVLTASDDGTAKLWNFESAECVQTFYADGEVKSAVFSTDGISVLTASSSAEIWELESGKCTRSIFLDCCLSSAVFSPDCSAVLTSSYNGRAQLWSVESGELMQSFTGHGMPGFGCPDVLSARFSPDGAVVLTASDDGAARLWSVQSGRCIQSFAHDRQINAAVFSADGRSVLTACADTTAKMWSVESGKCSRCFEGHTRGVLSAAFSTDEALVLTASEDGTAKLWSVETGEMIRSLKGRGGAVYSASFDPIDAQRCDQPALSGPLVELKQSDEALVLTSAGFWASDKGKCHILMDTLTNRLCYEELIGDGSAQIFGWLEERGRDEDGQCCWEASLSILEKDIFGRTRTESAAGKIRVRLLTGSGPQVETRIKTEEDETWQDAVLFAPVS